MRYLNDDRCRYLKRMAICLVTIVALTNLVRDLQAQTSPQAVALLVAPPGPDVSGGLLTRELVRQAVLVTAREEFGLATRDAALGEILPANSKLTTLPLTVAVAASQAGDAITVNVRILRQVADKPVELKTFSLKFTEAEGLPALTSQLEALSRTDLITVLEASGLKKTAPAPAASTPPEKAAEGTADAEDPKQALLAKVNSQLERWDAIVQFAAISNLHKEIRESGSNPILLAALARGYANLGTLTEIHWSPAHKVFKARALLYADRLVNQSADSNTLQTRAYVRALVGIPLQAMSDLNKAIELGAQQSPKVELSVESQLIKDFCAGNTKRLLEFESEGPQQLLARYLAMLLAEKVDLSDFRIQTAQQLLELDPGNLRAMDAMVWSSPLGIRARMSRQAPELFSRSVGIALRKIPNLPESIRELSLERAESAEARRERLTKVMQALAGSTGLESGSSDTPATLAEPSFMAAGHLIRETNFLHAWRVLYYYKSCLCVDGDSILAELLPLTQGHPHLPFLKTFIWDPQASTEAKKGIVNTVPVVDVEFVAAPAIEALESINRVRYLELQAVTFAHRDLVFRDLIDVLRRDSNVDPQRRAASQLFQMMPESPAAIYWLIRLNWEQAKSSADKWEKDFSNDVAVQDALSIQYQALKRSDDAKRCLNRRIELLPDYASYKRLAALCLEKGDEAGWVETQLGALKLPSMGLESSQVEVALAKYYIKKNELKKARKYAEAAAGSGAGWALDCAADCCELLEDWKAAEDYMQAISRRYETSGTAWYLWCRRTGRGDLDAARPLAAASIARTEKSDNYYLQMERAIFQYAEGEAAKALATLDASYVQHRFVYGGLHGALMAGELGQTEKRDKMLAALEGMAFWTSNHAVGHLIQNFRADLRQENRVPFDVKTNELLMHHLETGEGTRFGYFIGKFLMLRGRKEEAIHYLQWAATSPSSWDYCRTWAAILLEKNGIKPNPMRLTEWTGSEPLGEVLQLLQKCYISLKNGDLDSAKELAERALKLKPDSFEALLARANVLKAKSQWDDAIADYQKCLEISPNSIDVMLGLAKCLRGKNDFPAAYALYERAIKHTPERSEAYVELIPILSTSDDDKLRNGKRGLELAIQLMNTRNDVSFTQKQLYLAEACAEAGNFSEAIRYTELVLKKTPPEGQGELKAMLELFKQNKALRRPNMR